MYKTLAEAPTGKPLILSSINNDFLAAKLRRLGFYEGVAFKRLDKEILLQTVRVKGAAGEFVLGGGISAKVIVHLDDGRKLPIAEMIRGEKGHIEGLTGGNAISKMLALLGFNLDEKIEFVRKIPPMEYITQIQDRERIRLTEGVASKIWGKIQDRSDENWSQFCSAQTQIPFEVHQILGGKTAKKNVDSYGIKAGTILILKSVEQAKTIYTNKSNPIIVSVSTGLRFFLSLEDSHQIIVSESLF